MTEREIKGKTGELILEASRVKLRAEGRMPRRGTTKSGAIIGIAVLIALCVLTIAVLVFDAKTADAETGMASYFTRESCINEGSLTVMSNGKELNDASLVCASWRYPLGTMVRISSRLTHKSVVCKVTTRGPGRKDGTSRFYKGKRIADLSLAAMRTIDGVKQGVIQVEVSEVL